MKNIALSKGEVVMPRVARIVVPEAPHHVTQRGNRRQRTFFSDADYAGYLGLMANACRRAGVEIWAYCLMPNHVHLIAVPSTEAALAEAVGTAHLHYTRRINRREDWNGYLWQGRFASFPMDDAHLASCVRYIALNPVRAGLVGCASDWRWSSVRAHLEGRRDPLITPGPVSEMIGADPHAFFASDVEEEGLRAFRHASTTGRPLGSRPWLKELESRTGRDLSEPAIGRPRKSRDTHDFREAPRLF
jgi:putative transposase